MTRPLPASMTTLIGREEELASLLALLSADGVRCVTLTGPGGTGKTRLALALADAVAADVPDGIWFVPLAAIDDSARVPTAVAQALDVPVTDGALPLDAVKAALRERAALVFLDNVEQVVDAAPAIAELLRTCPSLTVVATSRIPLRIAGEHQFPVPPLRLPTAAPVASPDAVVGNPAVSLFVERARAVHRDFRLTDANAAAVAEVCRRLEGLPLAIELAAARTKLLPPDALLARLTNRLAVLTGGGRDAPARQRTMRAAVAWSHDLLSADERVVFRRLSACAGGCGLDAAEAIGGGDDGPDDVLAVVESLLDQSLLRQDEGPDGTPRVAMLEVVREYGLELLARSGEEEDVRDRHAAHHLALAEATAARSAELSQGGALDRMMAEQPNVLAALSRFLEHGDAAAALRMGSALSGFWRSRGLLDDGRTWLERVLSLPGAAPAALRARALNDLANVAADQGDHRYARDRYEASLALRRELGDRQGVADALSNLGLLASDQRDLGRARALLEESLGIGRDLGDPERVATTLANLGVVVYGEGRFDEAVALLDDARLRFAAIGDQRRIAYALTHLGIVARRRGDLAASETSHEEALAWYRACRNAPGVAGALNNLGRVAADRGDVERARRRYEEALGLQREAGNDIGVALVLANLAELAREQGDLGHAVTLFRESLSLRWAKRDGPAAVENMVGMADAVAAAGRMGPAARMLGAARAVWAATQPGVPTEVPGDDRVATELRRRLGVERFTDAVAGGRALSAEMAVAEALAVILPDGAAPGSAEQPLTAASSLVEHGGLTARELEVLQLVAAGKTNAEIGGVLFISPFTAKTHVANLLGKLDLPSRAAASAWAAQRGLL